MATAQKICSACQLELPVEKFYRKKNRGEGPAGYSSECKQCKSLREKEERKQNPAKRHAYDKAKYEKNKSRYKDSMRKHRNGLRQELIALLGGVCVRCGYSDARALQVDHINGGAGMPFIRATSSQPGFHYEAE